jgi:hypothetical protein
MGRSEGRDDALILIGRDRFGEVERVAEAMV